jgi:hypothetical protein
MHKAIISLSVFNFAFYRFLYGRIFNRVYFSVFYSDGDRMFWSTFKVSIVAVCLNYLPMIGISCLTVYKKTKYDQTVYSALDVLILSVFSILLLMIDGSKSGD